MIKRLVVLGLKAYQLFSQFLTLRTCRFYPSCSQYALEAVEKRGIFVGFWLTIWRIARCSPLSKGGYDPVR